jgi:hypothetical protein
MLTFDHLYKFPSTPQLGYRGSIYLGQAYCDLAKQIIFIPKAKTGASGRHITAHLSDFLDERMNSLQAGQEFLFPAKKPYRHIEAI